MNPDHPVRPTPNPTPSPTPAPLIAEPGPADAPVVDAPVAELPTMEQLRSMSAELDDVDATLERLDAEAGEADAPDVSEAPADRQENLLQG